MTQKKNLKKEIIETAKEYFLNKGFDNTGLADILTKLNISKDVLYRDFKSKDELLEAVVEDFVEGYIKRLTMSLGKTKGNAIEKISFLRAADKNFVKENRDVLEQLHRADNVKFHTWQLAISSIKLAKVFSEIIEQGCEEGIFKTDHPLESAEFLVSGIQFLTDEGVYSWKKEDLSRRKKAIPGVLEALLQAPKGSFTFLTKD